MGDSLVCYLVHIILWIISHSSGSFRPKTISAWDSMFRPLSRTLILTLRYLVRFGNSFADNIKKLLVGQGCLLRCVRKSRWEYDYIILTIFLLSSRCQMRMEIVECKLINGKLWYMLSLILRHCK